jgi:predicted phosphate transport protein (TIGR00153 family)
MKIVEEMFRWLLPRDERFKMLFNEDAQNLRLVGRMLLDMLRETNTQRLREKSLLLKDQEHRGDELTRQIFDTLNHTFLTPIDREDIRELASGIDDVLDDMEMVASLMVQFKLPGGSEEIVQMSQILASCSEEIERLVALFWDPNKAKEVERGIVRISELENQADAVFNLMITKLFEGAKPEGAIEVMKWKEVYYALEDSVDRAKTVAHTIGNIVSKNA